MHNSFVREWPVCFGLLLIVLWRHADSQSRDGIPDDITGGVSIPSKHRVRGFPLTHSHQSGFILKRVKVDGSSEVLYQDQFQTFNHLALTMNYALGITSAAIAICMIRAIQFQVNPSAETKKRLWFWVIFNIVVIVIGALWILTERFTDFFEIIHHL